MLKWKRTLMNAGVSLSVATAGAMAVEATASAHDATASGGVPQVLRGVVSAVGTGSITLTNRQGTAETVDTTSTTVFSEPGTPVPPVTVAVGQSVAVALDPSDATPTAARVTVLLDRVSGKVTDVTATSITLAGPRSSSRQVLISSITQYYSGKTTATGVTDGEFVSAYGTRDATTPTELDSIFVDIVSTTPHPPHGPVVTPSGANDRGANGWGKDHGTRGPVPPTTTSVTTPPPTPATTPPVRQGALADPDQAGPGAPGNQNGQGGPSGQEFGGGNGGKGGGFSGGGPGSGGHGGH